MQQPRRLGRGLGSLLEASDPTAVESVDKGTSIITVAIDKVFPNPDQPRKEFDAQALADLSSSIKEKGIIQPILVAEKDDGTYTIIAGERRYRASKLAGISTIPVIIRSYSIEETMEVALIENLQREDLNPLEEAQAFRNLIDKFNLSQEEIAQKIGKNRATVANSLRLLKLPAQIQQGIASNTLSAGHARALLAIRDNDVARNALYLAILDQGLSVRDAEWIAQSINSGASFDEATKKRMNKDVIPPPALVSQVSDPELALDVLALSRGATLKVSEHNSKADTERRSSELWDMEEKLIMALGTKVQIKGDNTTGKIEITYFSIDDLARINDLLMGTSGNSPPNLHNHEIPII